MAPRRDRRAIAQSVQQNPTNPVYAPGELEAYRQSHTDPNSPDYLGPGYDYVQDQWGAGMVMSKDPRRIEAQLSWERQKGISGAPTNPNAPTDQILDQLGMGVNQATPGPIQPSTHRASVSQPMAADALSGLNQAAPRPGATAYAGTLDQTGLRGFSDRLAPPPTAPGENAPDIDRERIDTLLTGVGSVQQKLLNLADSADAPSAAEAALLKASREADIRSALATEQSQRAALGAARSARNRGDRALLERQAVGEAAFIGQEGARTDALRQAEQEGNLAILRANEADANRRFKADILGKAADLNLNTAALEVNIAEADLASATNLINQEFAQLGLDKQIDQQQAEAILGFTQEMAALQFEYDKLAVDDQNETERLLMQKYGIDQQTMVSLKQIKEQGKFRWDQLLTGLVGGAATGGTTAVATHLLKSDRRAKTNIRDTTPDELAELLATFKSQTFDYLDPRDGRGRQFGGMAQDLQKSRLGRAMVIDDHPSGALHVDGGRAGMAALSGLAFVHDRLAQLESAVSEKAN